MKSKLTLILILFSCAAFAQWRPTNGLFSGAVHSIITSNNEIIVGTNNIYKSSDNGHTWFVSSNGMSGSVTAIRGLVKISTYLIAVTDAGAFYSTDNGDNWTQATGTATLNIWGVIVKGSNVFIGTDANGIYKSTNNGVTWNIANNGINTSLSENCFAIRGTDLYAGSGGYGIYKSTDDGATWNTVNTGLPGSFYAISSMGVVGTTIFAGTSGAGMYKSTDGTTWSAINNGITSTDNIMGIGVNGASVYASTFTKVLYKSTDYINWNVVPIGISARFEAFYSDPGVFYIGDWDKAYGLFRTKDDGVTFQQIGVTEFPVSALEVTGNNNILGGTFDVSGNSYRASLFKTTEADSTWAYTFGTLDTKNVIAIKASGAIVYAFDYVGSGNSYVYRSTNNGLNWTSTGYNVLYSHFATFAIAGSNIFAGDDVPYISTDNGATWNAWGTGIPTSVTNVYSLVLKGTLLFAGTNNGIYKATVGTNSWTSVSSGLTNMDVKTLCVSGTTLYAGTQGGGIFKSVNDGALWTDDNLGIPLFADVTSFATSGTNVFAGTDNGVFVTSNSGTIWSNINTGLIDTSITALTASTNYLWAGTTSQGVWRRQLSQIVLGINDVQTEMNVAMYPNPATKQVSISLPVNENNKANQISFYNSLGALVMQLNSSQAKTDIDHVGYSSYVVDISMLPAGIYYVTIKNSGKIKTEKLVVQ